MEEGMCVLQQENLRLQNQVGQPRVHGESIRPTAKVRKEYNLRGFLRQREELGYSG